MMKLLKSKNSIDNTTFSQSDKIAKIKETFSASKQTTTMTTRGKKVKAYAPTKVKKRQTASDNLLTLIEANDVLNYFENR